MLGMRRIAVVGGHGKVALQLHPLLVERGLRPVALVRSERYREELEGLGAEVRFLDIENSDVAAFADALRGSDAIVFTAGGGPDGNIERKRTVDLEGSLKSAQAAAELGVRRFVQVSAINVERPVADDVSPVWKAYVIAKRDADRALQATDLDWTILRPGQLTDEPGTGLVTLADDVPRGPVPRADVAAVIAAVLDDDRSIGATWALVGGDTPIGEAIRQAAA
jgi:uncharacterized protein YbjT (DUF2867 family)